MGEDFMHHARELCLASTRGQEVHQVPMKCMERYIHAFDLMLTDPAAWLRKFVAAGNDV